MSSDDLNETSDIIQKKTNRDNSHAGGTNTNKYGKLFENDTDNEKIFNNSKKVIYGKGKYSYSLNKCVDNIKIVFVKQSGFKTYIKHKFNVEVFRYPDEAYIVFINGSVCIKNIRKKRNKEQKVRL